MSKRAFAFLALLLALCVAGSLLRGESLKDFEVMHTLLLEIRLLRILACVLIGASLAISGAAVGMFFKFNEYLIQLSTFSFGFLAVAVALGVSALYSRSGSVIVLVPGGVISGSLFTSLLSVLKYAADPSDALPAITYFLMGSLGFASKSSIEISILPTCAGILLLALSGKYLNALSLGEEEAKSLGVNTARVKIFIILIATFVSALSVTIAGIIGWIGLIVPHIARFIFGADNRAVLASSAMIGAIFLLFCDSFSRLIFTFEIPIGIVTSLFGIPMFIIVLRRAKRDF